MSRKSFIPLWGDLKQTIDSYASSIRGLAMDVIQNSMDANREYNSRTKNNKPLKMRISIENSCLISGLAEICTAETTIICICS